VLLVAVPLSLGIVVASGAPVMAGLIAAVVGGIVCGHSGCAAMHDLLGNEIVTGSLRWGPVEPGGPAWRAPGRCCGGCGGPE
jgi:hypothetical protein